MTEVIEKDELKISKQSMEEALAFFKKAFPNLPAEYEALFRIGEHNWDKTEIGIPYFNNWFNRNCNYKGMVPLAEFTKYTKAGLVQNFVYFRPMGVVFLTLDPYTHTEFMATLRSLSLLNEGKIPRDNSTLYGIHEWFGSDYDSQDEYLKECLGTYQSSSPSTREMQIHVNFEMNAAEYDAFRSFRRETFNY